MIKPEGKNKGVVILGSSTSFNGFLRFKETLCIKGKFKGTIESTGDLVVEKGEWWKRIVSLYPLWKFMER